MPDRPTLNAAFADMLANPVRITEFAASVRSRLPIIGCALNIHNDVTASLFLLTDDQICRDPDGRLVDFAIKNGVSLDYLFCGDLAPTLAYAAGYLRTAQPTPSLIPTPRAN